MQQQPQRFSFTGSGSEYFRIWIVNLLLTVVTLGIYSAWAKVRRLQYFYRHTLFEGSSFDFHGSPQAILKGRIIAVVIFAVYKVTLKTMPPLGVAVFLLILAVMPLLLVKSWQFRLHYTSYRGLRFSFAGTLKAAYLNFLLYPALAVFSLTLLAPLAQQRIKKYQHANSYFGQTRFAFDAGVGGFFKIYLLTVLMTVAVMAVAGGGVGYLLVHHMPAGSGKDPLQVLKFVSAGYAVIIALMLFVSPYVVSRTQNLIWNNTRLGPHRFIYALQARKLCWIYLSNVLLVILTLGLFKPYADIRLARYLVESMAVQTEGDVESFVADQNQNVSAVGTEMAQLFDFDIGF